MSHLFQRTLWAATNLEDVQCDKLVVFEDPAYEHEPCKVMVLSGSWLAMALHGNLLPPIEAYHEMEYDIEQVGGRMWRNVKRLEVEDMLFDFAKSGKAMKSQRVVHYSLHNWVIPAMTLLQAIIYLIKKDLPQRVWHGMDNANSNYRNFRIVDRADMPDNKHHWNYWKLCQDGDPIKIKLPPKPSPMEMIAKGNTFVRR